MLKNKKIIIIAAAVLAAIIMVILGIIFQILPARDIATRYAPMAEAFANGQWMYAFHPRIQPLQTVSGGIISYLFQCDGFMALKIASMLWFFAGAFICWKLFRELYNDHSWIAFAATSFYLIFPYNIQMAHSGLRESAKGTILLLAAWALVKIAHDTKRFNGYILLGLSCFLAILSRADMILVALSVVFFGLVLEFRENKYPLRSLIASAAAGAALLLNSFLNWRFYGHAVPDSRFIKPFMKILGHPTLFTDILLITVMMMLLMIIAAFITKVLLRKISVGYFILAAFVLTVIMSILSAMNDPVNTPGEFLKDILKGCYHIVGILSLLVILYRLHQKKLTTCELLVCLVFLSNLFFNILPMQICHKKLYVSSRYIFPAVSLLAGFFVIGIYEIYQLLQKKLPQKLCDAALILTCIGISIGFIIHACQPLQRQYTKKKHVQMQNGILQLANVIRNNYSGKKYREVPTELEIYHSSKAPEIVFSDNSHKITVAAYLAGGQTSANLNRADFYVGTEQPKLSDKRMTYLAEINFGKETFKIWKLNK